MSAKVDLRMLKRFVSELEAALEAAEKTKAEKTDKEKYTIEMCKALGLVMGVVTEGTMLIGDLQNVISQSGLPPINKEEILAKILGKGGFGNTN